MCTEFALPKSTHLRLCGRTMDFATTFNWQVTAVPKGTAQKAIHFPIHIHPYAQWDAKYAFMGISLRAAGNLLDTKTADAMNDQGLTAASLWLPGSEYPQVKDIPETTSLISCLDICSWAVSNYADIPSLKADLECIAAGQATATQGHLAFWDPLQMPAEIQNAGLTDVSNYLPLHFQFHDKNGHSLVLEFRHGKMELTDNSDLGVMTNAPFIDWHLENLGNFLSVTNTEITSRTIVDREVNRNGNGGGFIGLSTSALPSDRFLRTTFLIDFAKPWLAEKERTQQEGAAFTRNLIGNIAVPREMCIDKSGQLNGDYTQWWMVRDQINNLFYIATAESIGCWQVDFKDYDLSEGAPVQTVSLCDANQLPALPKEPNQ